LRFFSDLGLGRARRRVAAVALAAAALTAALLQSAAAQAGAPYYGRAVAFAQPNSVWHEHWKVLARAVEADPDLDIDYFIHGELGGEEQMMHDLRRGRAHIGGMALQGLASTVPELTVAMAPYLFDSVEEVDFVYDEFLLDFFNELFAEKGLRILQWTEVGWTNVFSNGSAILTPDDAANLKLRCSPNIAAQYFLDAIGADAIPLASTDLVPSLQTGLVKGGLSSTVFHYFVTRRYSTDLTLTRHSYDTGAVVVNKAWFDAAPEAQKRTIRDGWLPSDEARASVRDLVAFATAEMRGEGIAVHDLSPEQRLAWKRLTAEPVSRRIIERVGGRAQETYDVIQAGKRAFAERRAEGS